MNFSIKNKLIVILFTLSIAAFGFYAILKIPIAAVPNITNNQSFIQEQIIIRERQAHTIPHEAIIKTEDGFFVQAIAQSDDSAYYLRPQEIHIGATSSSYVEVKNSEMLDKVLIRKRGLVHLVSDLFEA